MHTTARPARLRSAALAALATCALVAMAAGAPRAEAVVFGANLEQRPANNPFGCGVSIFAFPQSQPFAVPNGQTTCTWLANGRVPDFAETLAVPVSGVVRQIQVRVGPRTGPMQVVVYSALGAVNPSRPNVPPAPACCQVRALSQVFTPAPNQITTVPVNLPVVTEARPPPGTNILRSDSLGLSVLAPGVPVPAHNTGNFDALAGAPIGGVYAPGLGPGQERTNPASLIGFQVLLRADVTPAGSGGSGGGGGAGGDGGNSGGSGGSGSSGTITLSARQLGINQRIGQAAIRRLNAIQARLDGRPAPAARSGRNGRVRLSARQLRINQRIYQAAVRRANAIEARIEGRPAPANRGSSGSGRVTLTTKQLRINQRIAQAAVRRANALEARVP